ncbi:hypothetical protein CYY_010551, partial [Polysphondylium violaceum]
MSGADGIYPVNLNLNYPNGSYFDFGSILEQQCISPPALLSIKSFEETLKIPRIYPENNRMVYSIVIENIDRFLFIQPTDIDCGSGVYYCEIYGSNVFNQYDIFIDMKINTVSKDVVAPITAILKGNTNYQFTIIPPFNSSYVSPAVLSIKTLTEEMSPYLNNYYCINSENSPLKQFSFIGFSSASSMISDLNSMVFYQSSTMKNNLQWNHKVRGTNFQGFSVNNNQLSSSFPDSTNYVPYIDPFNYITLESFDLSTISTFNILTINANEVFNPKMNRLLGQGYGLFRSHRYIQYPMGFQGMTGKRYSFRFSFMISKYYKSDGRVFYGIYTSLVNQLQIGQADSATPDITPPVIVDLKYMPLENGMIHVICKVTDNLSGVVNIYFYDLSDNVITFMTLQNLVSGVSTDGSFEIVVNPLIYSTVAKVMILDAAGNSDEFYSSDIITLPYPPSWLYSAKILDQIQPLFTNQYKGLISIYQLTLIQFSENNLNLLQPKTIV